MQSAPSRAISRHVVTGTLAILAAVSAATQQSDALSAVGDFDADGNDEVLVYRGAGDEWAYYDLDAEGATRQDLVLQMGATVRFIGIGDFDADGAAELLARDIEDQGWRYSDRTDRGFVERLLPGMTRKDYWHVDAIGDFNGDQRDDVLLRRRDNGESLYYAMDGTAATARFRVNRSLPAE
ncbi:MAG: VCBS repeat-containing protein [Gammaproteobacteria bacterium]|nr:VCBS repeat-containing protein [Gammaproteobacteria bacterium]